MENEVVPKSEDDDEMSNHENDSEHDNGSSGKEDGEASGTNSTSETDDSDSNSVEETRYFNVNDRKTVEYIEHMAPMCNVTPIRLYKSLILLFDGMKRSKVYQAIKDSARNLRIENETMSARESLLLAVRNRRYLLKHLFEIPDSDSE